MSLFWDYDPFHELDLLQRRLDRLYNAAPAQALEGKQAGTAKDVARRGHHSDWRPHVDVKETDKEIVLHADCPGVSEADLNVAIEDGVLTVSGKREATKKEDNEHYHRVERTFGSFSRSVALPEGVDPAAVKANLDNGVLEVRVPKPAAAAPKKVSIAVAKSKAAPQLAHQTQTQPAATQQPAAEAEKKAAK